MQEQMDSISKETEILEKITKATLDIKHTNIIHTKSIPLVGSLVGHN